MKCTNACCWINLQTLSMFSNMDTESYNVSTLPTKPFSYGEKGRDSSSVPAIRNGVVGVSHASICITLQMVISALDEIITINMN